MRFLIGMACLCVVLPAQTRSEVERTRQLVEAGALPRTKLAETEQALEDLKDEETLRNTLYGSVTVENLTEDQTTGMVAAAKRQMERRRKRLDAVRALVDQGVAAYTSLYPLIEDLDRAKRTVD